MSHIILPKETPILDDNKRIYFLAGPVRGGGDWQRDAFLQIAQMDPESYVVCPCRYDEGDEIRHYELTGSTVTFDNQTLWERYYLERAGTQGCIMFWLASEDSHHPRKKEDGPYAQETYGELGEWRVRKSFNKAIRLVVGADKDFPGLKAITRNYKAMVGDDMVFYPSLNETIAEAVRLATSA